jgi:hypothetical protein
MHPVSEPRFAALIAEMDALIDYEMHGGEEAASWRARNNHPMDSNGECVCPACRARKEDGNPVDDTWEGNLVRTLQGTYSYRVGVEGE